jgi:hypothetical protein
MSKNKINWTLFAMAMVFALVNVSFASRSLKEKPTTNQQEKISLEEAKKIVIEKVAKPSEAPYGLRVHMYPELLPKGSKIVPFDPWVRGKKEFIVCDEDCWFFWFDDNPLAQFAHETRYVLVNASSGKLIVKEADWWPVVRGKIMWGKTEERASDRFLIFEKPSKLQLPLDWKHEFKFREPQAIPGCEEWAILICGSTDIGNTFDEDVQFLYNVFTGLGYDEAHIYYISPWTTDPGVDRLTTIANVQWAINQVAINSDAEDKVFFFYSSHGGVDYLHCCPGELGGGNVTSTDMDNWLDAIISRDLIILLQGCHTGSFIGYYSDGTIVTSENELSGDGETNRIISTATDTDHSSYGGSSTWGSTFTGGYVESFSDPAADVVADGIISTNEAYTYAYDHDVAASDGWSFPHMDPTSLDPDKVFHVCPEIDVWIPDGINDIGYNSYDFNSMDIWSSLNSIGTSHENPVSGLTNYVHVRVHNLGSVAATNVDVALYWANTSTALAWPADFHQIGTIFTISSIPAGGDIEHTWSWYVDPAFGTGHYFCFVATADCAEDPMTGGPPGYTYVAPFDNNIAQKNITIVETQAGQSAQVGFLIENNLRRRMPFDLVIKRKDFQFGQLILSLPDDLMEIIIKNDSVPDGLKLIDGKEEGLHRLLVTAKEKAVIQQIELKPMDKRKVFLEIIPSKKSKVGEEFRIRIEEMVNEEVIGANTFLVRIAPAGECHLTMKHTAEVYAQIALKYKSEAASNLVKMIGDGLQEEICKDRDGALKWMRMIFELEEEISNELKGQVSQELLVSYLKALGVVNAALEEANFERVMIAQEEMIKVVAELVSVK